MIHSTIFGGRRSMPIASLYQPAKTLTHARMLCVRASLPYPIGRPDVFAMALEPREGVMKKHFVWILFWFSTCGVAQSQNLPPAQNYPCAIRTIIVQAGETEHSILIAAGFRDVLVSISRDPGLPHDVNPSEYRCVVDWVGR